MTVWKKAEPADRLSSFFPKRSAERKAGDQVIGKYIGRKDMKKPDGTEDFVYLLVDDEGNTIGVNSAASIVRQMEQVPVGKKVRITFEGKKQNPKSMRFFNEFLVEVAADEDDGKEEKVTGEKVDPEEIPFE